MTADERKRITMLREQVKIANEREAAAEKELEDYKQNYEEIKRNWQVTKARWEKTLAALGERVSDAERVRDIWHTDCRKRIAEFEQENKDIWAERVAMGRRIAELEAKLAAAETRLVGMEDRARRLLVHSKRF